jgi:N-acetylmuramoyl-L-alanine amidase
MKRNVILCAVAAVLLSSAGAWAAPPFGSFGGIVGEGNAGAGLLSLTGWALDDNGVLAVDVLVDGLVAGRAAYGRARAGVTAQFPGFPDSANPGFAYQLDTTHYLNGAHTVAVRVKSRAGEVVVLPTRTFYFNNVEANLEPFGQIEFPKPQAEMRGDCSLANRDRRWSVVSGYALDAGTQPDDYGVGYVELLIDRSFFANSQTDCFFSPVTGGYSQCYGIRRLDVERTYPSLKDSPHSGFRFVIDVGALIGGGFYSQGQHLLTIRSGDVASQTRDIAEIPVTFSCDDNLPNENGFGTIDLPRNGLLYHDTIQVTGWALDWEGIAGVQVLVDGHLFGNATYGLARPDVFELSYYPGYPNSVAPGFRFALDTRLLANGEHFIDVIVTDNLGVTTYIGKKRIVVNNVGG